VQVKVDTEGSIYVQI